MENVVTIKNCPQCGHSHRYSLVEQHVAIQNAAFKKRKPRLSFLRTRNARTAQLVASPKLQSRKILVTAKCPNTGMPITLSFDEKYLTNEGLDPKRISLALIGPGAE